ncbi:MAG: methylthioribulose 1-phosphate dehydratase [Proteobacteria bacterium]|nr:methylthioribulose 1-phosphate dehydratase [Pseudomonadota bacterium]
MAPSLDRRAAATAILSLGRRLHARGWCEATSGNFSQRLDAGRIAITVSGRDKAALQEADVMVVDAAGRPVDPPDARPSAEAPLHCQLYRIRPEVGTVVHVHSPSATMMSRRFESKGEVLLEGYEMLKALSGVETHLHGEVLPVFANDQDAEALAHRVETRLRDESLHGYLLAGHGLYTWGRDAAEALRHVEALEFLLGCEWRGGAR